MHPTGALSRKLTRLRLTTKQASNRGGYYKGTGTGPMGRHTKHGGYVIEWWKVRTYVVPSTVEMEGATAGGKLSPFVTNKIKEKEAQMQNNLATLGTRRGRMMGGDYLELWKAENGTD